ncbi:bifunctional 3-(3-hydroxy-phenyl)propionate/3-hydroxycinnamic acid hydroxylase [Sphingobium sp. SCG-1]|uniref:bifunctional 3-(3-hydroxy-phenyl)propionate/3-hydroxycinnamic acid hydroxylase n=1 Tax=Sphingobium sp. SCG-1 TaxID=2072936 RepID=UPI001670D1AF|nr:bifunctional 3-(3-hydroxy-phenyl)propionate/3-hydroxycinnamic acid hydroxylase [Sphingobium sp. SCG-1]
MTDRIFECDVAIVGAGPVGATLAALLGQAGIRVFVGEANDEVYPLPRAAHFDHEIMRVFQQLDIVEPVLRATTPADHYVFQNQHGQALLTFDLRCPADTGWTGYMMHQPGVELAIRARLAANPLVELMTGLSYAGFEETGDRIVTSWNAKTGEVIVRSRYLVGCDGAWSPVREGLGITLDDLIFDEPWLVLDLIVDDDNRLPRHNIQYCDPGRPTTYVVMGDNRRRFEFMLLPGETAEEMLRPETIDRLLSPWDRHGLREVERKAVYRFHALIAQQWRRGRIFIAGDAAHQMPPFAGQGMCSGIRDAAALSWRLALALGGADEERLFKSYQLEREPHVRMITRAAIETGRVVCTLDREMAAARDAQMLADRAAGVPMPDISSPNLAVAFGLPATPHAGERFIQPVVGREDAAPQWMDDLLGRGAWLIGEGPDIAVDPGLPDLRLFDVDSSALAQFAPALRAWLGNAGARAVLVRGDRYVFGTGTPAELVAAYAEQAGLRARLEVATA